VVIADIHIAYHVPTHYQDRIKVGVKTIKLGGKSIVLEQCVMDADTGKIMAEGKVVMVTFDYKELKSIPVPVEWKKKFSEFEGLQV